MTSAPTTLNGLHARLTNKLGTVNLGTVGDDRHVRSGGYHIGAQSLRRNGMAGDYSLEFALDNQVSHDFACAVDLGGPTSLQEKLADRLVNALKAYDPRVYGKVRGLNGPFGGGSWNRRYDCESPTTKKDDNTQSTSDQGHIHIEIYRSLVTEQRVIDGLFSVLAGEPAHSTEGGGHPIPQGKKIWQGQPVPKLIAPNNKQYLGLLTGPKESHGGATATEKTIIKMLQQRLIACGFVPGQTRPAGAWADGVFGMPTRDAIVRFQLQCMGGVPHIAGRVYHRDWKKLFSL